MNSGPFTKRENDGLIWPRSKGDLGVSLCVTLTVALVAAVSGPFGTFDSLSLGQRLAYWGGTFVVGWGLCVIAVVLLLPAFVARGLPPLAAGAIIGLLGAVPLTMVVHAVEETLRPGLSMPPLTALYMYVAVIAVPMAIGFTWFSWQRALRVAPMPEPPTTRIRPRFLDQVSARLGDELVALKSEDHYVRIYTRQGDDLVLMRLSDALAELDGAEGMQVHRSYWVARAAVEGADRVGRRRTLRLSNGLKVPVGPTFAKSLKESGWLLD